MPKRYRDQNDEPRRPRLTTHEQILMRLRREMVEIGEPSRFKVTATIFHLGDRIAHIDMDETRNGLLQTMTAVIVEQPHKISFLSGVIQVVHKKNPSLAKIVVEFIHTKIQEFINEQQWTKLKLFVRFLASLKPIIHIDGIKNLLRGLLDEAVKYQNTNKGLAQELYMMSMLALPYLGTNHEEYQDLLEKSKDFDITTENELVQPISDQESKYFVSIVKQLDWEQQGFNLLYDVSSIVALEDPSEQGSDLQKENANGAYHNDQNGSEYADQENSEKPVQEDTKIVPDGIELLSFPAINIDIKKDSSAEFYQTPRVALHVYYPISDLETVPDVESLESVLLRDIAADIIRQLDFNRKEVTRQLITLDLFLRQGAFADPGISIDNLQSKIKTQQEEGSEVPMSSWKVEDVALESILESMFKLPEPDYPQVYYHVILVEACVMAPQAIAPVFGRAVRYIFNNLETLDIELNYRFLEWFSHHLSNFGFQWKWHEWAEFIEFPKYHPKRVFIEQLVTKEIRLSYPQRILETLPKEFADKFIPVTTQVNDLGEKETVVESGPPPFETDELADKLIAGFSAKEEGETTEAINQVKEKILEESIGSDEEAINRKLLERLVRTLSYLGSRSLSHAETWIIRSSKHIEDNLQQLPEVVIETVLSYWSSQIHVGFWILRFYRDIGVISNIDILKYILSRPELYTSAIGWETIVTYAGQDVPGSVLLELLPKYIEPTETTDEDEKWLQSWNKGLSKALIRKFRKSLVDCESDDEYISSVLALAKGL